MTLKKAAIFFSSSVIFIFLLLVIVVFSSLFESYQFSSIISMCTPLTRDESTVVLANRSKKADDLKMGKEEMVWPVVVACEMLWTKSHENNETLDIIHLYILINIVYYRNFCCFAWFLSLSPSVFSVRVCTDAFHKSHHVYSFRFCNGKINLPIMFCIHLLLLLLILSSPYLYTTNKFISIYIISMKWTFSLTLT